MQRIFPLLVLILKRVGLGAWGRGTLTVEMPASKLKYNRYHRSGDTINNCLEIKLMC